MIEQTATPWWTDYFTRHYGRLYQGPFKEELPTDREVKTLERLFAGAKTPILDVCCGYGRHLSPLFKSGLPIVGVDLSADLLGMLPKGQRRRAVRGDMRRLPFRDGALSGAYLLFNSFGYFDDEENAAVLAELARVLAPGAPFVADMPSRAGMRRVVRELPTSMRCEQGLELTEAWDVDDAGKRLLGHGFWDIEGLPRKEWNLSVRLYTPSEVVRMLRRAGFEPEAEVRPLGELDLLGNNIPAPTPTDGRWRRVTNMIVLAKR